MGLCGSNDKNMTNDLLGPDGLAYGGACPPLPKGWCGVCGVRCAVCGVRCAVCGVRCAVCVVWCGVCGVRCAV
jgi:hypothetical protein